MVLPLSGAPVRSLDSVASTAGRVRGPLCDATRGLESYRRRQRSCGCCNGSPEKSLVLFARHSRAGFFDEMAGSNPYPARLCALPTTPFWVILRPTRDRCPADGPVATPPFLLVVYVY